MATADQSSTNGTEGGDVLTTDAKDLMCEKLLASEEMEQKIPTVYHQFVSPRTITGPANQLNVTKGAIDWSYNGLVAYGSNYTVVVMDTTNMQPVQCLDRHKAIVNNVLWSHRVRSKVDESASVELMSSDMTGHIIHWDITIGTPLVVLQDGNKPVLGMEWVPGERNELLLATLHAPYYLVMWDINKQTKLWKKGFLDNIFFFQFNPFNNAEIAFMCMDCILFLDDFNPNKIPSSNGRKFYISSPRMGESEDINRARERLKKLMKGLVIGDSKPRPEDTMTVSECLGLSYHRSLRHHMLLQYPRDILIIDLHINQTVGIVTIEKTMTPFVQVIPARQRDVLYCLHDSGSVSVKVRRKAGAATVLASPLDMPDPINSVDVMTGHSADVFLSYEHRCQSEVIRQMKGSKVLAIALDPITEKNIVLLLGSGKLVHLELDTISSANLEDTPLCLSQMFRPAYDERCVVPPLRLMTTGLLSAVASPLTVIRMCPPLTTRNRSHYNPIMAGGTLSGTVQIYNMATGIIEKELALHNQPVRGIEWTGLTSFLSFAFSSQTGKVNNELLLTDVQSGQSTPLRHSRPAENPIDMVRVSPLRQYFVVVYKDGPFELWDLKGLALLRTMPKKFPFVTALEWSPVHSVKSLQAKTVQRKSIEDSTIISPVSESGSELVAKEHLVFSDTESHLYHFSVDGSTVRDGIKIPPESGVGMITCIAFKSNQIVQADVDGSLNIWDLKSRSSRNSHTGRGWIRKIRFSPGKGNLKLLILYSDGVDIVDLKNLQYERLAQLKCPKDMVKVVDVDWAAPDTPVLATEDGCLRIMDCKLTQSASSLSDYTFKDPVCCPALLPPPVYAHLQCLLSTCLLGTPMPAWSFSVEDGFALDQLQAVNDQVSMMRLDLLDRAGHDTLQRSLTTALLLRDQPGITFWTVCQYYLQVAASCKNGCEQKPKQMEHHDSYSVSDLKRVNLYPHLEPLDTCYDVLCDPYAYQRLQLERVGVHEWRRGDYKHTQKVVERLILLGEMDRAVQLLLETDLDNPHYYTDGIKACLVATIQSTGAAQSTIKLVATNLIANGKIWEGVQLLCLIGKGLDGCRYLSSYGLWESAVWLAKSTLPPLETLEVLRKWAEHLIGLGEKEMATLVLLSQGQASRVLELLLTHGQVVRAGLLLLALRDIRYPVDKSLFAAVQTRFCEHMKACEPLAGAMAKLQPVC
uniref:WD repeat-containing protein 11 n=1 Tax=Homalodisca liturata TaxID=320908 RepID=A0A1B6I9I5_9HEMI